MFKVHFEKIVETLKIDRPALSIMIPSLALLKVFPIMLVFSKSRKEETLLIAFPLN